MGELPDWYPAIRAARYMGVPPWELHPSVDNALWGEVALAAEWAENATARDVAERQRRG